MQGSFWKTVAVVGVIGIGSLAILEVQNRLPKQNVAGEPTEEELATLVAGQGTGDSTVTPELSDSEFDRMMKAAQSETPIFDGAEPAPEPGANASLDAKFFNSDPVAPQPNTPPVDTNVRSTQLAQGPNPFEDFGDATAVAANYQGEPSNAVEPVGFVAEESFAADSASESNGYRREGVAAPEPASAEDDAFSLFPSDSSTDSAANSADNDLSTPLAGDQQPNAVPNRTDAIEFFNGNEPAPDNTGLSKTAQFYENDAQLRATPEIDAPNPFPETPQLDRTPSLAPSMEFSPDEIVPFQNPGSSNPEDISPPSDLATQPFRGDLLEPQDGVPEPRDVQPRTVPEPDFPTFNEGNYPEPERTSPTPDNTLPSIDEFDGIPSGPFAVPELEEPGRISIPETQPRFNDSRFEEDSRPFEALPSRETAPQVRELNEFPPQGDKAREFESEPRSNNDSRYLDDRARYNEDSRSLNIETRPELRHQEFDDTRPFNEAPREFNSSPDRNERGTFPLAPEISPRPGTYESKPPMRDTRPADYNLSDRSDRGAIRQVSGVMRPNLMLEKTAPENATVGVPLDYKIFVRNEGDAPAYDVVVEDEISAGTQIDGARPVPDRDRATNRLVWKFAEIAPNQTEEILVRLTPTGEGTLDGVATVKFKSRVKATTVITAPKLHIEMTGPKEVKLGEEVAYRYVITNEGSGEARDVFVRTLLPPDGGLSHPQGQDLEYEIGTMSPGQQREIVLAVVAGEPGEYQADAIVSGTGGAKDQAGWRTNIIGAQLQIVRRGPKRRYVGKSATYENIVSNETNFDAVDARIVETIPEGMRFKGASKGGYYDEQKQTVTWKINRLEPGRQEQLQIQLMPTDAGQRESVVTVFENAGLQSENYVSTTVVEDLHNVGAQMSQLDGPVAVGETFGFTITVDNRGTADATDVELVVDVPQQIEVLGAGTSDNHAKLSNSNQVQYSKIIRIEPNERQTFELKLRGTSPVRNKVVTAKVRYRQMEDPLIVGESVTIYQEEL